MTRLIFAAGRQQDGWAPIKRGVQSKWIIGGQESNLVPTKWLICPFHGNLGGGSSPEDSRSVTAVLSFHRSSNASTNTISAPDALMVLPTPPVLSPPTAGPAVSLRNYSGCRRYCWQLLLSLLLKKKPGSTTKTYPCQRTLQRIQDLGFCEDKHH